MNVQQTHVALHECSKFTTKDFTKQNKHKKIQMKRYVSEELPEVSILFFMPRSHSRLQV